MLDKYQLIESIIDELDELTDARGLIRCAKIIDVFQKVTALKKGLHEEDAAHKSQVETLKQQLDERRAPAEGETTIGGEHCEYHFGGDDSAIGAAE